MKTYRKNGFQHPVPASRKRRENGQEICMPVFDIYSATNSDLQKWSMEVALQERVGQRHGVGCCVYYDGNGQNGPFVIAVGDKKAH